jgi:23S rRNA (uracil1939-C5)-methyltransferase
MIRTVRLEIERLAPTGEGVARLSGKTIFVEGALPGETVDVGIFAEKRRFARGQTLGVERASPHRRATDGHSARCGATDWAHFDPESARAAKRNLFLETMQRIGSIPAETFGVLPISESPLEYRLRNQFHLLGESIGFFERQSHRVVPLDGCEVVSAPTRAKVAGLARTGRLGEEIVETIESIETVETGPGHELALWNRTRDAAIGENSSVGIRVGSAEFSVAARSFFQVNRFRIAELSREVGRRALEAGGSSALDAYSGVGFFTRCLAEGGYRVTAVEASASSVADAERNRCRLSRPGDVRNVGSSVEAFLADSPERFDCVVADPPRAGLGDLAVELARRARGAFLYISCDPASLARDLRAILPLGFVLESALLEDFFPLTHRVEAFVSLRRVR